jgi:hypothetical protein
MEGHKRRDGTMLCPSISSLPSPPDSPTRSLQPLPAGPFHPAVLPEIVIPNDARVYRRQNPNWVDSVPAPQFIPPPPSSSSGQSVVSTVLLDDGSSIKTSDEDDDTTTDDENDSVIEAALGTSIPLASIFSTPKEHIADLRKAADAIGLHTGLMRRPGARNDGKSSVNRHGQRECSWWVVMGRNAEAVRHLVDIQQRGMPGYYEPDKEVELAVVRPSSMGFLQVVLAGAIGGAAVLFGMAKML